MFICDKCGVNTLPGVPCTMKVVETRPKHYVHILKQKTEKDRLESKRIESDGTEIVKEIKLCPMCVNPAKTTGA